MRTGRLRSTLLARLERLESRMEAQRPVILRLGDLRRLPEDYTGERHVVITKHLTTDERGQEWVEFAEVPGPKPSPAQESKPGPIYFNIVFDPCPTLPPEIAESLASAEAKSTGKAAGQT
jgi:hypothetical protein